MYSIEVVYPERDEEMEVIERTTGTHVAEVQPIMSADELVKAQTLVREVPIARHLAAYVLDIARASRLDRGKEGDVAPDFVRDYVEWGAGPRAAQYMVTGAKARALIEGRTHVTADDIRHVARPVLTHRIIVNFAAEAEGIGSVDIIDKILESVQVPDKG